MSNKMHEKVFNMRQMHITIPLKGLDDAGLSLFIDNDNLEIHFDEKYDKEFAIFLDAIPKHLSNEEEAKFIDICSNAYRMIMLSRIFNNVAKIEH